jgi:DNA-binding transcriptional regulator GbsR (MarR family)
MGDFFEQLGLPPIGGRIFAWLLVCEPEEQDAAQIGEAVDASAGSVNSMVRLLMRGGLVERRGQPGSRKHLYRLRAGAFHEVLLARVRLVSELKAIADEGLEAIGRRGRRARRLVEMRDFYAFFERELPALVKRYEARSS